MYTKSKLSSMKKCTNTGAFFLACISFMLFSCGEFPDDDSNSDSLRVVVSGTLAGKTTNSGGTFKDGLGDLARFYNPYGVAVSSDGNVYVTDGWNHRIRKITPEGEVTTIAGSGENGSADGTGTMATFGYPSGIAIDSDDNLYVADTLSNRIRKVITSGVDVGKVSTIAGDGTTSIFHTPRGLAIGPDDNLYVADTNNNRIRKVTPAGVVSTPTYKESDGTVAMFKSPMGITVSSDGTIYVADTGNNRIRKITADVVSTIAGDGTAAIFDGPRWLAIGPDGNLYVADSENDRIRKIVLSGGFTVTNFIDTSDPYSIAFAPNASLAYIANSGAERISYLYLAQ